MAMGYARYTVYRRGEEIDAGYGVTDVCNAPDCATEIDRGLGHLCGETPGGDECGCGGYFCDAHLYGGHPQLCPNCKAKADAQRRGEFCDQIAETIKTMDGVKDAAPLADKPEILIDLDNGEQHILTVS